MRAFNRRPEQLRPISFETHFSKHAEGSCFAKFGETHVLCTASIETRVPPFLRNKNMGWVTAEYSMLPRATHTRTEREGSRGKLSGRTQEIQRLIGRSLRAVLDLGALGERQIVLDCDVLQADGGTRTAAISGAYVALYLALQHLIDKGILHFLPLTHQIAAISCGMVNETLLLDLDYEEDSQAAVDANFILTDTGNIIEVQTTAEKTPFEPKALFEMMRLAQAGVEEIIALQRKALKI